MPVKSLNPKRNAFFTSFSRSVSDKNSNAILLSQILYDKCVRAELNYKEKNVSPQDAWSLRIWFSCQMLLFQSLLTFMISLLKITWVSN